MEINIKIEGRKAVVSDNKNKKEYQLGWFKKMTANDIIEDLKGKNWITYK